MYASALEIEPNNANAADDLQKLDRISRELDAGAESDEDGLGCHLGPGVGVGRLLCGLTMLANARILSATRTQATRIWRAATSAPLSRALALPSGTPRTRSSCEQRRPSARFAHFLRFFNARGGSSLPPPPPPFPLLSSLFSRLLCVFCGM